MTQDRDLREEQEFLDEAYAGLDAMRREASRMLRSVLDLGRGGTFQSRTERDIVVRTSMARMAQLDIGDQALCFGRIDRVPEQPDAPGESFHIGRIAVSGEDHEPLVVDWRAPVAEPFYRATGLDPQGLSRRRHLALRGKTVIGVEDEVFGDLVVGADDNTIALGGAGALLAALGHARTGQMADIVATIQREQDEIIRSPLGGVLMVQGGPGTGKTAVALHRAAYLLYTHRFPLERQGVLVVGPNPLFLRYIERVLPSLGETGVTLSTASGLVSEIRARQVDPPAVARLKGDPRMAAVMARAVRTRERPLARDAAVAFGAATLRIGVADSERIVGLARRRPGTHNARRRFVEQQVVSLLVNQYEAVRRRAAVVPAIPADVDDADVDAADVEDRDAEDLQDAQDVQAALEAAGADLRRRIRRAPEVGEALDRMWPRLAPHELVHDLFGAPPLLAVAGRGILDDREIAALARPRSRSLDEVPWTTADAALVDEARALLGPRRTRPRQALARERAERSEAVREDGFWPVGLPTSPLPANGAASPDDEGIRSYGHIVVDEAQDLSPMQLRMLARRSISGSMTVVGDIAQATGPWTPDSWDDVAAHLAPGRATRLTELTVGYRTPAEVVAMAAGVLAEAAPGLRPPRPVRHAGSEPTVTQAALSSLAATVADVTGAEMAAVGGGRTAVLSPASLIGELGRELARNGLDAVDPRDANGPGLAAALVLLPAGESHGLEFDAVVVVEPALIAAGEEGEGPSAPTTSGLRALYVALTRPTRRLAVVHSLPLPIGLAVRVPTQ